MDKIYITHFLKSRLKRIILYLVLILASYSSKAQGTYELNTGWKFASIGEVKTDGYTVSNLNFPIKSWMEAVVPGTVLTSLLHNQKIKDPFLGMNNEEIPDIYKTGPGYYTYWFVKDFKEAPVPLGNQVYLDFRGVNYSCNIYFNGHKLNKNPQKGMFLRFSYNITRFLAKDGKNRLAVLVYPPDFVGNANGGQGGDGTIARNVGLQYTAGWDWIQPVRDRNTGIWDKVSIQKTGPVRILEPHIITQVPGIRLPEGAQKPAILQVSAVLSNPSQALVQGTLKYEIDGKSLAKKISLKPGSIQKLCLPDYIFQNPRLWWPNGYGPQNLYKLKLSFLAKGNKLSDQQILKIGFRQLSSRFNSHTGSRQIEINGQKIFIKGGNWIISDAMLRLSKTRYDAEIRFHRDMNLNLIRIWGGAMVERPEFYEACDKYGLLVFQDLWISGDCNGRWQDPMKKDDQWTRRKYPDDHSLFIRTAEDQIKMVRNHPSLAIWY